MSGVTGWWQVEIRTPIGVQRPTVQIRDADGELTGTASDGHGEVVLRDVRYVGGTLSWSQSITRPMKLTLEFQLTVTGDGLAGVARAGRLPRSQVTGHRIPEPAGQEPHDIEAGAK
jgi:hypothetical protein